MLASSRVVPPEATRTASERSCRRRCSRISRVQGTVHHHDTIERLDILVDAGSGAEEGPVADGRGPLGEALQPFNSLGSGLRAWTRASVKRRPKAWFEAKGPTSSFRTFLLEPIFLPDFFGMLSSLSIISMRCSSWSTGQRRGCESVIKRHERPGEGSVGRERTDLLAVGLQPVENLGLRLRVARVGPADDDPLQCGSSARSGRAVVGRVRQRGRPTRMESNGRDGRVRRCSPWSSKASSARMSGCEGEAFRPRMRVISVSRCSRARGPEGRGDGGQAWRRTWLRKSSRSVTARPGWKMWVAWVSKRSVCFS
jgi:hypothetical protein